MLSSGVEIAETICRLGLQSFFLVVTFAILSTHRGRAAFLDEGHASQRPEPQQFVLTFSSKKKDGWRLWWPMVSHRAVGALHFIWLTLGSTLRCSGEEEDAGAGSDDRNASNGWWIFLHYDVVLGVLGMATTWTASRDFPHKYVRNYSQSGTLSQGAIVTQNEMMEHFYYQALNLVQALYLHLLTRRSYSMAQRYVALALATAPWLVRTRFPVHPFSQNWVLESHQGRLEILLYRIKKSQYLFYKHFLLHGMNLTAFLHPDFTNCRNSWRLFWDCLNASYVLEFFLQSLVKRKALEQSTMLFMNRWLMFVSTLAACLVLWDFPIPWICCGISLVWNWVHRHHDFSHTLVLAGVAGVIRTGYLSSKMSR